MIVSGPPALPAPGGTLVLVSHVLCPYVQRAAIVLAEKGLPFERLDIDLSAKPEWFQRLSPLGKTPMLLVPRGAQWVPLFESAVICDYLDETVPPALHPADALARAQHRGWVEVASATLNTIGQLYGAQDATAFELRRGELERRMQQLEAALQTTPGPWFGGEAFSLVDAAFAPVFRYFEVFEHFWDGALFDTTPRVRAWRRQLAARPSVRDAVSPAYPALLRSFVERRGGVLASHSLAQRTLPA